MENESIPSQAIEKTAKPKVGVTFRIEQADLDKFKAVCAGRKLSQAKQFVEWIRQSVGSVSVAADNSTNDSAI